MSESIGYLTWWKVGTPRLYREQVKDLIETHQMDLRVPRPVHPGHALRRLTDTSLTYQLNDQVSIRLELKPADAHGDQMVRHLVRIARAGGVVRDELKLADLVVTKHTALDARGRSRFLVNRVPGLRLQDEEQIAGHIQSLRTAYADQMAGWIDAQGLRRLVRELLANRHALLLGDGLYFVPHTTSLPQMVDRPMEHLRLLLSTARGEGNTLQAVRVFLGGREGRAILDGLRTEATKGTVSEAMGETYKALGLMQDDIAALIWKENA